MIRRANWKPKKRSNGRIRSKTSKIFRERWRFASSTVRRIMQVKETGLHVKTRQTVEAAKYRRTSGALTISYAGISENDWKANRPAPIDVISPLYPKIFYWLWAQIGTRQCEEANRPRNSTVTPEVMIQNRIPLEQFRHGWAAASENAGLGLSS